MYCFKLFLLLPILVFKICYVKSYINNACYTYLDYYMIQKSSNCFYSPDIDDHPVEIINRYCGVNETYEVTTKDGYILTVFRIPKENPKGVVLLQHPIFSDSKIWLSQFNESAAFFFWRNGYDVWLGNSRGTTYSKRHVNLTSEDLDFWNYSFHEMGYFDNEATIRFIRSMTNEKKIIYIGYSLSATSGLIYASTRDEEAASSAKLFILLTPVTHLHKGTTLFRYFLPTFFHLNNRFHFVDDRERPWKENSWLVKQFKEYWKLNPCKKCFAFLLSLFSGWSSDQIDPKFWNSFVSIIGSEVPLKMINHFYQNYKTNGTFRKFDFGSEKNLKLYGNETPPIYPLENIKVPLVVIYGEKDNLVTPEDQQVLIQSLPTSQILGSFEIKEYAHHDFLFARDRFVKVFNKILDFLNNI